MKRNKAELLSLSQRAYEFGRVQAARIALDEVTSGRFANIELELAIAYMHGALGKTTDLTQLVLPLRKRKAKAPEEKQP